jgi:hypothetical protein
MHGARRLTGGVRGAFVPVKQEHVVAIHSQQGPSRDHYSRKQQGLARQSSHVGNPPELTNEQPAAAEPVAPRDASESKPTRSSRARAIWGLAAVSMSPGVVVGVAPTFWHGLPTWAQWSGYAVSGVLMLIVVGLILAPSRAAESAELFRMSAVGRRRRRYSTSPAETLPKVGTPRYCSADSPP